MGLQVHPLVKERVFETVDGTTRIYSMPYTKDVAMWQLSFPFPEEEAKVMLRSPAALKAEALRRCAAWHAPIPAMLAATPLDRMSGGPVYDRDFLTAEMLGPATSGRRVTLLGDAAHPMSPFKVALGTLQGGVKGDAKPT